jgi:hypothetical protein
VKVVVVVTTSRLVRPTRETVYEEAPLTEFQLMTTVLSVALVAETPVGVAGKLIALEAGALELPPNAAVGQVPDTTDLVSDLNMNEAFDESEFVAVRQYEPSDQIVPARLLPPLLTLPVVATGKPAGTADQFSPLVAMATSAGGVPRQEARRVSKFALAASKSDFIALSTTRVLWLRADGIAIAPSRPMIAMTTNSSVSVNACSERLSFLNNRESFG